MKYAVRFIFLLALIFAVFSASSQTVSLDEAMRVSSNYLMEKGYSPKSKSNGLTLLKSETKNESPVYYIFQLEGKGFIITSGSKKTYPVLAYSLDQDFGNHPAAEFILDRYKQEIITAEVAQVPSWERAKEQWSVYSNKSFTPNASKGSVVVAPLLNTTWDQSKYYNTYCPWDASAGPNYDYRVPNGCVALCMAQIMYYYRAPNTGVNGVSYIPPGYDRQEVVFSDHTYNYDVMTDNLTDYTGEMAKLVYHAGVATRMGYNPTGSGTYTTQAMEAMAKHFQFASNATVLEKKHYTNNLHDYKKALMNALKDKRPIVYSGSNQYGANGHAFMIDGYDSDSLFHVNWGWGGSLNGYFHITSLTPGSSDFSYNDFAFTDVRPRSTSVAQPQEFTRNNASTGFVSNTLGNITYSGKTKYTWMLAAPNATAYTINIKKMDIDSTADMVTIYNGGLESDGILRQYTTNSIIPDTVTVSADSVLIVYTSSSPNVSNPEYTGFYITYQAALPERYCAANTNITASSGTLQDGSHLREKYIAETQCSWTFSSNTGGYNFTFRQFDLKEGDFIDIYNNARSNRPVLWKRFDIYNLPELGQSYICTFPNVKINFVTDNWNEGEGFELDFSESSGVKDLSGLAALSLSPNPASDFLTLEFTTASSENIICKIFDVSGKLLISQSYSHSGGTFSEIIPISQLADGLYMMHIETTKGKSIRKFIVN